MSLLFWNYRGLGKPWANRDLPELILKEDTILVLLRGTNMKGAKALWLKATLDFSYGVAVDTDGKSERLTMWWKQDVDVV